MKKIYLASASPRRLQLLRQIGIEPEVVSVNYRESMNSGEKPEQIVINNAMGKAQTASQKISTQNSLIIAADTIVAYQNRILGKPATRQEASQMLTMLSGKEHYVFTGVCVLDSSSDKFLSSVAKTSVEMREISQQEIEAYASTDEPYDKAGGYGIQQLAGLFVKSINGSYSNVVGLPLGILGVMLKRFGYEVSAEWQ